MFTTGEVYKRRKIHNEYGGNWQKGISPSGGYNIIFLFSSESGEDYGYKDGWTEEGIYYYTGEGQVGDMEFTRGNKEIRDHQKNNKNLYLFEKSRPSYYKFVGEMAYIGHHFEEEKDKNGNLREVIVFELQPISESEYEEDMKKEDLEEIKSLDMSELRDLALKKSSNEASVEEKKSRHYKRSNAIKEYANRRADGVCELCDKNSPFLTKNGTPYLEVHHIFKLSDGGPDHPERVAALCPNCHREAHYGKKSEILKKELEEKILEKEAER